MSLVPPVTKASPVLKAVPVNLRALEGRLVIMLTPSEATVLIPEVPAPITVVGARIMLLGASRTKPVPVFTALSAKLENEVGALVRTFAPALRAFPVALNAVKGTWPTVEIAPVPRLTTWAGVWAMAVGTPLTSRMVLEGAFLMLSTPKSVTVLMVSGTVLMVLTVRSDTVLTVCGTIFTPDTAVSDTVLTASGTLWTSCSYKVEGGQKDFLSDLLRLRSSLDSKEH